MKSLVIIRHAKSSWETITDDFNRTLNDRGKRDAPVMAKRLLERTGQLDLFVSSPAKRAKKTAQIFAETFGYDKKDILLVPELYEAPAYTFYNVINTLDDKHDITVIFAHNPGITSFVNSLTDFEIDEMPTCGIFGVKISADSWSDFETAPKEHWFFDYPKLVK